MAKLPRRREEQLGGYVVHGLPFPVETSPDALAFLKQMAPLQIEQQYSITYLHSYGQDSPWFAAATNRRLLGNRDPETGYTYATPRGHDMVTGQETEWVDLTNRTARVHAFTVCHFGSEEFLPETPFVLALVVRDDPLKPVIGGIAPYFGTSMVVPATETVPTIVPSPGRCPLAGRPAASHSANAVLRSTRCGALDQPRSKSVVYTVSSAVLRTTRSW